MIHLASLAFLLHPIGVCAGTPHQQTLCTGYNFWSGIGSDLGEITLIGLALAFWHQHNCHVNRCWRLSWHPHPSNGHPVCKHHHPGDAPEGDDDGV